MVRLNCFVQVGLGDDFPRSMHGQHCNAAVDDFHAVIGADVSDGAAAAIVMRSRLIDNKSASSSTRIVATAFTGRIKTHAVTAIVTMICVKALIRISPQLLSAAAYCRIPPASPP